MTAARVENITYGVRKSSGINKNIWNLGCGMSTERYCTPEGQAEYVERTHVLDTSEARNDSHTAFKQKLLSTHLTSALSSLASASGD
jgi:hypothetical protein